MLREYSVSPAESPYVVHFLFLALRTIGVRRILTWTPVIVDAGRGIYQAIRKPGRSARAQRDASADPPLSEMRARLRDLETLAAEQGRAIEQLSVRTRELEQRVDQFRTTVVVAVYVAAGAFVLAAIGFVSALIAR